MDLVTIKGKDEVYVKVSCDPSIAMEISERFTFDVPGAKFTPLYRNKMWDGKIRLFNPMTCLLYKGLTKNLEDFCSKRNYDIEYDYSNADTEFSLIEAKNFVESIKPKHTPRDYQYDAFVHGVRKNRALLLSPTSSGKSLIIYLLARYYNCKTLIIVPTISLVRQMTSDFIDYGLPSDIEIHQVVGGVEKTSDKQIIISTWQSIFKQPKAYFKDFDLVIGDEAHLFKAKSLTSIMTGLVNCKYRFGTTGTLDGSNCNALVLEGLFGPVHRVITTSELIEKKHAADFTIKSIILKYPDEIRKLVVGFDYQKELDFIVTNAKRNKFIKNLVLSLQGNTLVLFQFVEKHGKPLYDLIKSEAGDRKVYFISGDVSGDEREEIRHTIETDKNAIIIASYGTTSTGVNIINLHNVIFTSPSKSRVRNLQSIGRVLRKSTEKVNATLYDIADDFSWKSKKNYTFLHLIERIKIYAEEKFNYKTYNVELK